jgi:hypothetical protein
LTGSTTVLEGEGADAGCVALEEGFEEACWVCQVVSIEPNVLEKERAGGLDNAIEGFRSHAYPTQDEVLVFKRTVVVQRELLDDGDEEFDGEKGERFARSLRNGDSQRESG